MTPARGLSAAVLLLSLALIGLIAWVLLAADPRWSTLLLVGDDAGYYLAIARNVCLGYGASFDRIHPTNGFNPLYTLLLVGFDRALVPGASVLGCYRAGPPRTLPSESVTITCRVGTSSAGSSGAAQSAIANRTSHIPNRYRRRVAVCRSMPDHRWKIGK